MELDYDHRHRRRLVLQGRGGLRFLLDLPRTVALCDGDVLELEDGRLVAVEARPETVVEIRANDAQAFATLAWHLGNRHIPTQVLPDRLRIRDDHVIVEMLRGLGASVEQKIAAFHPQSGAYEHHSHG